MALRGARCHPWSGWPCNACRPHQALHASSAAHARRPSCPTPGFIIIKGGRQTLRVPSQPHCLSIRGVLIVAWELTVISELRCQTHGRRVCCPLLGSPLQREAPPECGSSCTPSHLHFVYIQINDLSKVLCREYQELFLKDGDRSVP